MAMMRRDATREVMRRAATNEVAELQLNCVAEVKRNAKRRAKRKDTNPI